MHCTQCEDSGYIFDTYYPCDQCELGKPIRHKQNKQDLKRLEKRCRILRKEIKAYENKN